MPTPVKVVAPQLRQRETPYKIEQFLPIANGTHFNGNGGAASTSLITGVRCRQTRKLLRVIAPGADQLQVEWANIWTGNTPQAGDATCEFNAPNSITARMTIEYPAGNMRIVSSSSAYAAGTAYALLDQVVSSGIKYVCIQAGTGNTPASSPLFWRVVNTYIVNWDDQTDTSGTVLFAVGDYKKSRPIILSEKLIAGDLIAVLGGFDSGNSANYIPYAGSSGASNTAPFTDWVVDAAGALPAVGSALCDTGVTTQTNGNTTTLNSTTQSAWMKIPYATAITGNSPNKRCVALFGDSLMLGTGGDVRDGQCGGVFVRAMDGAPYWMIAQGGNRAGCYTPSNAPWQLSCVARCTSVLTDLGVGDIQANLTFAQYQAVVTRLWRALNSTGVPVYSGIYMPISNSSDTWATTTNQSRWTNGGAANTTQFPTDDATFLTSIYGLAQMWLGQDGATWPGVDGVSTKVGQINHPLDGILDWHGLMADPATSWKWNPGYTTDGAHPVAAAATVQAVYLAQQLEPVVMGRNQMAMAPPQFLPHGEPPMQSMPRHQSSDNSPSIAAGTFLTVLGVSSGRYFYGFRCAPGAAVAASRNWTLLTGMDPAKLKVQASGSFTPVASTIQDTAISGPVWIPAGHVVVLALTVPATTANVWLGANTAYAGQNKQGLGFLTAGKSTDTSALTGTKTIFDGVTAGAGVFAPNVFRLWAELY